MQQCQCVQKYDILKLVDKIFGFDEYMAATTMDLKLTRLLLDVLNKALQCQALENQKLNLLESLMGSNFMNKINLMLM